MLPRTCKFLPHVSFRIDLYQKNYLYNFVPLYPNRYWNVYGLWNRCSSQIWCQETRKTTRYVAKLVYRLTFPGRFSFPLPNNLFYFSFGIPSLIVSVRCGFALFLSLRYYKNSVPFWRTRYQRSIQDIGPIHHGSGSMPRMQSPRDPYLFGFKQACIGQLSCVWWSICFANI